MERGVVHINKDFELEYRYHEKNPIFKYFNRKFEIFLIEKKTLNKNYVLHIDNADPKQIMPALYKTSSGRKKYDFGISTLNWNDIKTKFTDCIVAEIGENNREYVKKAIGQLSSPKI